MDLDNLTIFIEVMRKESFSTVARDRGLVPSTVSRAIASLEDELGTRLLQRTTRRIKPTEAGQVYFQRIEPIIDDLRRANSLAVDLAKNPAGELRLTASMTFGNLNVVPLLPEFMAAYPQLDVYFNLSDSVVDLVDEGIDVAIRFGKVQGNGLVATRLRNLSYVVVASPEYLLKHGTPAQLSDLQFHECLQFQLPGMSSDWLFRDEHGKIQIIKPQGRLKMTNALALRQCALNHLGITLVSVWSVIEELRNGSLIPLFSEYEAAMTDFETAVWLVYPSRKYLPLKVRVFIDYMKRKFSEIETWDRGSELKCAERLSIEP